MNNKHILCLALLAVLVMALFDLTEACKKCGVANCNCIPMIAQGHGLGLGHGHGLGLCKSLCKPSLLYKQHQGGCGGLGFNHGLRHGTGYEYGAGYGVASGYGYGYPYGCDAHHHQYPSTPSYYGGYGRSYHHLRKPWYKPRCRCL